MIYGIAPRWRGRGLGSRAARLGAQWATSLPGVSSVELRIDQDATASQHVAVNTGFVVVGTVIQFVPGRCAHGRLPRIGRRRTPSLDRGNPPMELSPPLPVLCSRTSVTRRR